MKTKKLHLIGNAHIDPVWLWQWQEGFHEVKATFRSALDRMQEYDDFVFVASSAAFYAWVEQSDPEMFAEIRRRVQEGRWQIVGGWWVEPDCNIPSGESFARQALYAQGYFQEKFARTARVGYAIDSFGHNAMLPQLLRQGGLSDYVFMRPMPAEKDLPGGLFWWESDDGSRVMALRLPFSYASWGAEIDAHVRRCAAEIRAPLDEFVCFYGVGNHGGGPTRANIEAIHRLNHEPGLPELVCSGMEEFFAAARAKDWPLPLVHTELQHHASGCYAAHSGIKRLNRLAENRLLAAEKWSALAAQVNRVDFPLDFERAWKNVLFNQFHDILAGTSLEAAYEDARNTGGEALAIADRNLNLAQQSFAWQIRTPADAGMRPLVVFNPLAWPVTTWVEVESDAWEAGAVLLDDQERVIPHQALASSTATWRVRLGFRAELPALGYRTYRLYPQMPPGAVPGPAPQPVSGSDCVLENERLRLEIDPQTGWISGLFDKAIGVQVFNGPAACPLVYADPSDTWSHNVFKFDHVLSPFRAQSVRRVEAGPGKAVIRVISTWGSSILVQDFALYAGMARVDVNAWVDWGEPQKMLKLRFPVNVQAAKVTHEIPYGALERPANGEEEPVQSWVDVSGTGSGRSGPWGLSLLNDGKYSLDVQGEDIGLTVLRSPVYAHHEPTELEPGRVYHFIDSGAQSFSYTLLPHGGGWEEAGIPQRAAEINQRPTALWATAHPDGRLPLAAEYIRVEPEHVLVTVFKGAEAGEDWILRAYESAKKPAHASIYLPTLKRVITADFRPAEIKTWRVPRDPAQPALETNFLEQIDL